MNFFCVILALAALTVSSTMADRRPKRMLFGDFISSFGSEGSYKEFTSPYDAMYYSVSMKPGWGWTVFDMEWDAEKRSWDQHDISKKHEVTTIRSNRCGGAFLTPRVVQTACHCVAHFYDNKTANKLVWEEPLIIYAVASHLNSYVNWDSGFYSPKRYYAHRQCHRWSINQTRIISYDFGLITLAKGRMGLGYVDDVFPRPLNNNPYDGVIKAAPYYTIQDLNKHYLNIIKRQSVCLHIGAGYDKVGFDSGLLSIDRTKKHKRLGLPRHTWRVVCGYRFCHDFVEGVEDYHKIVLADSGPAPFEWYGQDVDLKRPRKPSAEEIFHESYTHDATFSCSMNAGKAQAVPTVGDGGYPVTCNNIYFAVQGLGFTRLDRMDRMSFQSPIAFTSYENSAEYRSDFREKMTRWGFYYGFRRARPFAERSSDLENVGSKLLLFVGLLLHLVTYFIY